MASHGQLLNLGLTTYQDAYDVQLQLHEARAANRIEDVLILTEHLPIYTLGRTTRPEHVGGGREAKSINGIPLCMSDRGGSVTYHGPGQICRDSLPGLRHSCSGPTGLHRPVVAALTPTLAMLR